MGRRLVPLTLDNLPDLPKRCRSCVFWELDPVSGEAAVKAGRPELEKEAWISAVLLEWGSCGRVVYVDEVPVGFVMYAPPHVCAALHGFSHQPGLAGRGAAADGVADPRLSRSGAGAGDGPDGRQGSDPARLQSHRGLRRCPLERAGDVCCPPIISSRSASRPYGPTPAFLGCALSYGPRFRGRKTSSWLSTACWEPFRRNLLCGRCEACGFP